MALKSIPQPTLCLVTDRRLCLDMPLVEKVALAVEGGVNMVQLREKDLPSGRFLELALEIRETVSDRALLIINERVDVALACGADGIHLGEEALSPSAARYIVGEDLLIGRSVHDMERAIEAQEQGSDYLIAGTVFATASHPSFKPSGVGFMKAMASAVRIPYLGIGGINASNAAEVIDAGASGVAVISAILASDRPGELARELWEAVKEAWESRLVAKGRQT